MNWFEKILYNLQGTMERPIPYGWFHLLWIFLTLASIIVLILLRKKHNDKNLKWVLGIYGIITFILELLKQLIWAFNYDPNTLVVTCDYTWYAAPFQLRTTPMYVSIICLFLFISGCAGSSLLSLVVARGGRSLVAAHGLLVTVASLVVSTFICSAVKWPKKRILSSKWYFFAREARYFS